MKQSPQLHGRAAFGMVELLITITLIAVLSWLLLPALSHISVKADALKSLTRVRNLQLANIAYAIDNDNWYVTYSEEVNGSQVAWYTLTSFREYLGFKGKINSDSKLWPAALLSPKAPGITNGSGAMNRSYGYNGDVHDSTNAQKKIFRLKVSDILRPNQTLAFADALNWWVNQTTASQYDGVETGPKGVAYRYGSRAAVVYFDGRGELLTREQVVGNNTLWLNTP